MDRREVQRTQKPVDGKANPNPSLTQLSVDDKVLRESKKYFDARMAAEAAFASASFAAMAARAAVELSRTESQGKGGPRGGGYGKAPPVQTQTAAAPSWRQQKSPSPSPSWSDRSTATSVGSDKGKEVMFDRSDGELEDEVAEDIVWPPPPQRRPSYSYRRAASTVGTGAGPWNGNAGARPFQDGALETNSSSNPAHRRHATEFAGGDARAPDGGRRGQYVTPPYRRDPAASTGGRSSNDGTGGGAYESSAYTQPAPYARIVSALERGNEHIARHEEVRRIGTDARVLQEQVYGAAGQGHGPPLNPERRANSVRTRR